MSIPTTDTEDWSFKVFGPKDGLELVPSSDGSALAEGRALSLLAVSPDSRYFAAASAADNGTLVCGESGELVQSLSSHKLANNRTTTKSRPGVLHIAFLANGAQLVIACANNEIEVYDVPSLELRGNFKTQSPVENLQSLRSVQGFAYATADGAIYEVATETKGGTKGDGESVATVTKTGLVGPLFAVSGDKLVTADSITLPSEAGTIKWIGEIRMGQLAAVAVDSADDENHLMFIQNGLDSDEWLLVDEACPPFGDTSRPFAWFAPAIGDFPARGELTVLSACSQSTDLLVVAQNERFAVMDDSDKLPFTTEEEDIAPSGAALLLGDEVAVNTPLKGIDSTQNMPLLLILSQEGRLLAWHLASRAAITNHTEPAPPSALTAANITLSSKTSISDEEVEEISHDDAHSPGESLTESNPESREIPTDESDSSDSSADRAHNQESDESVEGADSEVSLEESQEESREEPQEEPREEPQAKPQQSAFGNSLAAGSGLTGSKWASSGSWAQAPSTGPVSSSAFSFPKPPKANEGLSESSAASSPAGASESLRSGSPALLSGFKKSGFDPSANPFAKFQSSSTSSLPAFAQTAKPTKSESQPPKSIFGAPAPNSNINKDSAPSGKEEPTEVEKAREAEHAHKVESQTKAETEAKSRADADAKEQAEAQAAEARAEAEAKARAAAEAKARAETEAKARAEAEAEAKAKAEREAEAKALAEQAAKQARLSSTEWTGEIQRQFISLKDVLKQEDLASLSDLDSIFSEINLLLQGLDHNLHVLEADDEYRTHGDASQPRVADAANLAKQSQELWGSAQQSAAHATSLIETVQDLAEGQAELSNQVEQLQTELDLLNSENDLEAYYLRPLPANSAFLKHSIQTKYAALQKDLSNAKQQALFAMLERHQNVDFASLVVAIDTIDSRLAALSRRISRVNAGRTAVNPTPLLQRLSLDSPNERARRSRGIPSHTEDRGPRGPYAASQSRQLYKEQVNATADMLNSLKHRDPEKLVTYVNL